ncbi:MAG: GMC family oxidoreductase N-terminal domain-containing protein [Myxococcales bacterium]|nr:GMC family oxidoreductase N-terminal domain-containing protein [Myxococcales bacterium]
MVRGVAAPIVIVGAGSSGVVVANRLTCRSSREVWLLEAGPDYDTGDLPPDLSDGRRNSMTAHDWGYRHKPSRRARLSRLPRGRVVGGSSAVNTCIALRGQPADFDEWADRGLSEWSFEACMPAFCRLERDLDFSDSYHGRDGPLPIRRHPQGELVPVQAAFLEACAERGYEPCHDSNAPGQAGYGPHAMNKIEGRRISAAEAYLTPAVRARDNLRIVSDCHARRVLFSGVRAIGVEVERRGRVERVDASTVILCAGAINTPGILLRSGVGADAEVRRLQCEPVLDAPAVGRRLLDHPGTGIFVLARRGLQVDRGQPILQTVLRFPSGAFDHPADMLLQPASYTLLPGRAPLFGLVTQVGKPRGHGRLHFPSADPHVRPRIQSRFFEHQDDRRLGREALKRCLELLDTRALSGIGRPMLPRLLRGDRALERVVSVLCDSGYHPCGTVPMGSRPGPDAATDGRGRVFGLHGLFVVDASLMPTVPSSNIHLPTLMMAERLAEWLDRDLQ